MASRVRGSIKFATDIATWNIIHPKENFKIVFCRKTTGEKYFLCRAPSYTGYVPLSISSKELDCVFDETYACIRGKYTPSNVTGEHRICIDGGKDEDVFRLTLVFSLCDNVETIDIRKWWRHNPDETFRTSPRGFSITGRENIMTFIDMREEISKRVARVDMLDELINKAHGMLHMIYSENCIFHSSVTIPMNIVNIKEFSHLWSEEIKQPPYKDQDLKISGEDMYTYVAKAGLWCLKGNIECTEYLLRHMEKVYAYAYQLT